MPILPQTHNEGDWFIVMAPSLKDGKLFNGTRYRVDFNQGEARTDSEDKAREFDELYGYNVQLPTGHPGWDFPPNSDAFKRDHKGKPDKEESVKRVILDRDSQRFGEGIAPERRGPGRPKKAEASAATAGEGESE